MEFRPQPGPQEKFLETTADIAFYGGAAGGGKTCALLMEATRYHELKHMHAVIFRRESVQVRIAGGLWDESINMYSGLDAEPVESILKWRFSSGADIKFTHLEHEKDVLAFQGGQIPFIGFDEITHFTEKQFRYMISRNRSPYGIPCRIRGTCNPDPDSFVRQLIDWYIDENGFAIPERSGVIRWFAYVDDKTIWADSREELIEIYGDTCLPMSFTFIPAMLSDNKILMQKDPSYKAKLHSLSKIDRERLLGGNWNIRPTSGVYFKQHYFEEVEAHPRLVKVVRCWDRAATEWKPGDKGDPDATVGFKMGMCKDKQFYILDIVYEKVSALKVEQMILNYAKSDGNTCHVKIFQDPGSAGKGEAEGMIKLLRGFMVSVEKITNSKEVAAKAMSAQAENKNIKILKNCRNKDIFYKEMEGFPELKHDDIVDGATGAFNFLNLDNTGTFSENMIQKGNSIAHGLNAGDQW